MNNNELSYYRLTLLSFLKDNHPELFRDGDLVSERVELATQTYSNSIKEGFDHTQAEAFANLNLFNGLHFSKYNTLKKIIWDEFEQEIDSDSADAVVIELLPQCDEIFSQYDLNDEFSYSVEFDLLYKELTGTVLIWLENEF